MKILSGPARVAAKSVAMLSGLTFAVDGRVSRQRIFGRGRELQGSGFVYEQSGCGWR
jgi:hypothetical protein